MERGSIQCLALWYMGITLGCLPGERGSSPRRVAIILSSSCRSAEQTPSKLRVWYRGCALAFQAKETGSNPVTRSKLPVFGYARSTASKLLGSIKLRYEG